MPANDSLSELGAVSDTLADEVLETLYSLRGRRRGSGSGWVPTRLIERYTITHPGTLRREAIRAILSEAREALAIESPDHADILLGRFWEGLTVEQMVGTSRPQPWQERNFQIQQRRAVERISEILWEKEVLFRQEEERKSTPDSDPAQDQPTDQSAVKDRQGWFVFLALASVLEFEQARIAGST